MDQSVVDLYYGSLLHDIGKVVQRSTQQKIGHSKLGYDYLKKFLSRKEILNQVKYHHYHEIRQASLNPNDLAFITYIADNISSGVDRREHGEAVLRQWDSKINLEDVFNTFGEKSTKRYFQPKELNLSIENIFANINRREFSSSEYSGIMRRIEETLQVTSFDEAYMQSFLNLFEATTSFIPSSTNMKEVVDISLYDHSKMTAGFAAAIYQYLQVQNRTDYKEELFKNSKSFYEEEAFQLVSFDLSGIQDFIYTITSTGAHKQLRSRSFYLDMMCEWIADTLLEACQLTRANLMYSGGGHAYLILPNTDFAQEKIRETQAAFNQFFLKEYTNQLYVAFGSQPFSAKEVMVGNDKDQYRKIFQQVSAKISEQKLKRYTSDDLFALNRGGKKTGRECAICHRVDNLIEHDNKCVLCEKLERFSRNIQRDDFFEVNKDETGLPIGPNAYLHHVTEAEIKRHDFSGKIYAKNQFHTGLNQATRLWIADYSYVTNNQYSDYAERKWTSGESEQVSGVQRIGVLRCDVDDLGFAFMAGFSTQDNGIYNTFTRSASFSRSMSLFFKLYINAFAESKKLSIIYAGGDDVFLLGAWDDVIVFSIELREAFLHYTNGKLTLSTGVGLFADKTPINIMARLTGDLEQAAKDNGKNSICLFSEDYVFKYDVFINEIYHSKLKQIRDFFGSQNERGKAFIYKILSLIRERDDKDRISFARLAYYLARLESAAKDQAQFQDFKMTMKNWFDDDEQIRQVEMALTLYLYETRKDDE